MVCIRCFAKSAAKFVNFEKKKDFCAPLAKK